MRLQVNLESSQARAQYSKKQVKNPRNEIICGLWAFPTLRREATEF